MSHADTPAAFAAAVADRLDSATTAVCAPGGAAGRDKCLQDITSHLIYLQAAVTTGGTALFHDYIAWAKTLLRRQNLPPDSLVKTLLAIRELIAEWLPEPQVERARACIDDALAAYPELPETPLADLPADHPYSAQARAYRDLLLAGRRAEATALIMGELSRGVPIRDLYLHVFQAALYSIGRLWQSNRITVAQEHYFTAATQVIMSQLYPTIMDHQKAGRTLVGTCVSGELHEIGIRMLTDLFELEGWNTHYLGANVPPASVVEMVSDLKADILAISATIAAHLPEVQALIQAVRASPASRDVKIMVGGYPFNVVPDLWRTLKADGCAPDAVAALTVANALLAQPGARS